MSCYLSIDLPANLGVRGLLTTLPYFSYLLLLKYCRQANKPPLILTIMAHFSGHGKITTLGLYENARRGIIFRRRKQKSKTKTKTKQSNLAATASYMIWYDETTKGYERKQRLAGLALFFRRVEAQSARLHLPYIHYRLSVCLLQLLHTPIHPYPWVPVSQQSPVSPSIQTNHVDR